jgi:hypothetical protein
MALPNEEAAFLGHPGRQRQVSLSEIKKNAPPELSASEQSRRSILVP